MKIFIICFLLFCIKIVNADYINQYENEAKLLINSSNKKLLDFEDSTDGKELITLMKSNQNSNTIFINSLEKNEYNLSTQDDSKIFVFISFSMPENLILEYIEEAKYYNAILVLKGLLKDNKGKFSVSETVKKIMEITNKKGGNIIIHPQLFDNFKINQVPTILKIRENYECISNGGMCTSIPEFDKISGSISIKYATQLFKENI